jgi:hypothetical protein
MLAVLDGNVSFGGFVMDQDPLDFLRYLHRGALKILIIIFKLNGATILLAKWFLLYTSCVVWAPYAVNEISITY